MATKKAPAPRLSIPSFESRDAISLGRVAKALAKTKSPQGEIWQGLRELGLDEDDRSRLVVHLVACGALPVQSAGILDLVLAELDSVPGEQLAAFLARLPDDPEVVRFHPALTITLRALRTAEVAFDELMKAPPPNVHRSGTLARLLAERPVDEADRRVVAESMLLRVSRRALTGMDIPMAEGGVWRVLSCDRAEDLHALLDRVVGAPWRALHVPTFAATGPLPDEVTVLGYADAPLAEVEALLEKNTLVTEALFTARRDSAKALLALAERSQIDRVWNVATAVALTRMKGEPEEEIEARWTLLDSGSAALGVAALRRLTPRRAGAVIERTLHMNDGEPEFRDQALLAVLPLLGPWVDAGAVDAVLSRAEELCDDKLEWASVADRLADGADHDWLLGTLHARAAAALSEPRRRGLQSALRAVLRARVHLGGSIPDTFDLAIDPAGTDHYRDREASVALLATLPADRAERVLDDAWPRYREPREALWFLRDGLSDAYARRIAQLVVDGRDDDATRNVAVATGHGLRPLGPRMATMIAEAIGDEPIKARFRAHLARVLDPAVAQALEATLSARPEKKKARPARK